LGNFNQHLKCSSSFGVTYATFTWLLIGIDWLYGSVALLLSMLGGMLPDLDSDSGKEIKHIKSISAVLGALVFWVASGRIQPPMAFEARIWITLAAAAFCSNGIPWFLGKITVHRGMFHSIPTCFIWGSVIYLHYPHPNHYVRVYMALGIMVGYFSHLCCDEYFSIESLAAMRFNKAFGTAMKFWSGKLFATLMCYAIMGFFVKQVADEWPRKSDGSLAGIGRPSESVDRFSSKIKGRAKNAVKTVKSKGVLEFLKETLTDLQRAAGSRWNDVRENALTEESLRSRYGQLKESTKTFAEDNRTFGTLKQLAVEAKSTVTDQVQVDKSANADRPLIAGNSESDDSRADGAGGLSRADQAAKTDKKKSKIEVYVPRRRSEAAGRSAESDNPRVIARQDEFPSGPINSSGRTRTRNIPR